MPTALSRSARKKTQVRSCGVLGQTHGNNANAHRGTGICAPHIVASKSCTAMRAQTTPTAADRTTAMRGRRHRGSAPLEAAKPATESTSSRAAAMAETKVVAAPRGLSTNRTKSPIKSSPPREFLVAWATGESRPTPATRAAHQDRERCWAMPECMRLFLRGPASMDRRRSRPRARRRRWGISRRSRRKAGRNRRARQKFEALRWATR